MQKHFLPLPFILFILLATVAQVGVKAQSLSDALVKPVFHVEAEKSKKRKTIDFKTLSWGAKLNPITYIAAGTMFVYQNAISQQLTGECTYEVSCSDNMKRQIQQHGFVPGMYFGFFQWSSCDPKSVLDFPAYKINTASGKIKNHDGQ